MSRKIIGEDVDGGDVRGNEPMPDENVWDFETTLLEAIGRERRRFGERITTRWKEW